MTILLALALLLALMVGILARGYWTPDEPREADLAWRMSWQASKAVPLLAGEPFCEKPPLTYWVAGAAMHAFGSAAWVSRLPNLLYGLVTALAVGMIGRRNRGNVAGLTAAAAISTFLLSYQVTIWLATDAPLLAAVAVALWGLDMGFYARNSAARLGGYSLMHAALAVGFLSKSAAAWMVPALSFAALVIWERRYRELLRWELYTGLVLQAAAILGWGWVVYAGPDGPQHLKVFFWNNLAGRFARLDAPAELQYASAHRNTPGKYLIELPIYLFPWTLLVIAAARRAWLQRCAPAVELRLPRLAIASFAPTLAVLSIAATARNIYLAPALPGLALLLGSWVTELRSSSDAWDRRAVRATAALLLFATLICTAAVLFIGWESWAVMNAHLLFVGVSATGVGAAALGAAIAWRAAGHGHWHGALIGLALAYSALLIAPASQIYRRVDAWQNLAAIGTAIGRDAAGRPLVLVAPDETTRAFIDMYARTHVVTVPAPASAATGREVAAALALQPQSVLVTQLSGRNATARVRQAAGALGLSGSSVAPMSDTPPPWTAGLELRLEHRYELPNGRRYATFVRETASASR